jgi:hypothetical protein
VNLDNYVDVATRLKLALEKYPNLRVSERGHEIATFGDTTVLICSVCVWRDVDDEYPVIASASEPLPGRTPYTRNSELMVGMTSALGRALGYMGVGITSSIASRNEVEARQDQHGEAPQRPVEPRTAQLGSAAGDGPSQPQLRMLKALGYSGPTPRDKREASSIIDGLKKAAAMLEEAKNSPEDPF